MSSTTTAILAEKGPLVPTNGTLPSAANQLVPKNTIVTRDSSGRAVSPSSNDASGFPAQGISNATYDNRTGSLNGGGAGDIDIDVQYGVFGFAYSGTTPLPGDLMYVVDNQTISTDDNSATRGLAGACIEVRDGKCYVEMGPGGQAYLAALATHDSDVTNLMTDAESAHAFIPVALTSAIDAATGALLAVFADGASTTPGTQLDGSKVVSVRWNNHATPGAIAITQPMPADLNDAAAVVVHALVSKSGATVGDATKLTIAAYFQTVAALYDADVDAGGDTGAVVGNATAKTVAELTLSIAAGDVPPAPCALTLEIKPKAGTLGTDDFFVHAVWLEYTRKLRSS